MPALVAMIFGVLSKLMWHCFMFNRYFSYLDCLTLRYYFQ